MPISGILRRLRSIRLYWSFLVAALLAVIFSSVALGSAQQKTSGLESFNRIAAQADKARDANDMERAVVLYRRALEIRPGWAEGWWSLGTILYDSDKYPEAAGVFQRVVALQPQHGSARLMLGLCQFQLGQDDNALRNIQKGRQLGVLNDPQLRRVMLYHEGVLLLRKGRFEGAQKALDLLGRDGVDSGDLVLTLGMSVLRIRPENLPPEGSTAREIVLRAGRAESLAASKNFDEARQEYNSLAKDYAEAANIHYAYGRFLLESQEIDAAVAEFRREIQNNPQHVLARLEIAAVRYRLDSADGIEYAQDAVKLDPHLPFGHYLLGLLYLDTQNLTAAISELETAKRSYARVPQLYFALGNAYARAGRKADAARARAAFARLNAENEKESKATYYGGDPTGLLERNLESGKPAKPPE